MQIKILGTVPSDITVTRLTEFLKLKKVPAGFTNVPQHYKSFGEFYGVRWDLAVFQSCLETAFFKFGGDVKPSQNNFGGLGATGGGVAGESYESQAQGVHAQIQVLAIRPGYPIPKAQMISKRYQQHYKTVFGKQTYWHQLAGTWAADLEYWDKIQAIAREFSTYTGINPLVEIGDTSDKDDITWWEFNRRDDGKPTVTGYQGGRVLTNIEGTSVGDLCDAFMQCKNANSFLVADTRKIIPDAPTWPEIAGSTVDPDPEPQPTGKPSIEITKSSPNQSSRSQAIDTIVLHNTAGAFNGSVDWLCNPQAKASAHLVVSRDGRTAQLVPFDRKAWHAGNANSRSIGIEIEAYNGATGMTAVQEKLVAQWVRWFRAEYGIAKDRVIPHRAVSSTSCPGLIWPTDEQFNRWVSEHC